jgi:hypothetical protein
MQVMKTINGKWNITFGLWVMALFMIYGFILAYLRDVSPNREAWIASSLDGSLALARLGHVHGNLFAVLNIVYGFLLLKLPIHRNYSGWISGLALAGFLAPVGILAKLYLNLPPFLVLVGNLSVLAATVWLGWAVIRMRFSMDMREAIR